MTTLSTTVLDYTLNNMMIVLTMSLFAIFALIYIAVHVAEKRFSDSRFYRKRNIWMGISYTFSVLFFISIPGPFITMPTPESIVSDLGVVSYPKNVDLRIPKDGKILTLADVTVRDENGTEHKYDTLTLVNEGNIISLVNKP